jgi:epoxyqueuosine reductase
VLIDRVDLWDRLQAWAQELGFSQIGVSGVDLSEAEPGLAAWLAQGFHGEMAYMAAHGMKRARPSALLAGTVSVITARMDYLPAQVGKVHDKPAQGPYAEWQNSEWQRLSEPHQGVVSLYARGRDYHKVMRQRLQQLAHRLQDHIGPTGHRVFTDSAPVLEVELAQRSGLGWRGKHTLLLNREGGSMFFLGEVFIDLALSPTPAQSSHCGTCSACIDVCPTQAIVAPYRLDARRCISYLTIEHPGAIDLALRPLMGNRVYGCDDCQLACPWNKYAQISPVPDFAARSTWTEANLLAWLAWSEGDFLRLSEGSAIRRIGHVRWLRNVAVALGNALRTSEDVLWRAQAAAALQSRLLHPEPLVREHVQWALDQMHLA